MRIGKCIDKSCRGWLVAITTRLSAVIWGVCNDCGREVEVQVGIVKDVSGPEVHVLSVACVCTSTLRQPKHVKYSRWQGWYAVPKVSIT